MNMMQMVAAMVICYFITLTLLSVYRNQINTKIANLVFIFVDLVFFFSWNYAAYLRGWLNDGFMTLENISPFIMTLIPLTLFMSEKVKRFANAAIAFLWVGMFFALLISPQHAYIFNFNIEASFIYTSEAACHLIASLYGAWLIISGQVPCNLKSLGRAVVAMYGVVGYGVLLNYLFHIDNFGMDPYGKAHIYMLDVLGSFEATLLAYLLGIFIVLVAGIQFGHGLKRLVDESHGIKTEGGPFARIGNTAATDEKREEEENEGENN